VAEGFTRAAGARGVPLHTVAAGDAEAGRLYGARYALVRPDGSVAWRDDTAPEDPGAVLDTVRGAVVPSSEIKNPHDPERMRLSLPRS
jgi:hypothetical protein